MRFDDQPINKSVDDQLLRSPVAEQLSEAIRSYKRNESFVIGIQGEWGEGKTSFINMVLENFESEDISNDFVIVKFNPWYFTGDDQILKQFCNIFGEKLNTEANGDEAVIKAATNIKKIAAFVKPLKDVANFAGLSIGVPGIGSMLGATAEKAANFAKDLEEAYKPTEDLIEIKGQIQEALEGFNKKIVVVIDDIDRLSRDEVYEIFRLVKIIADFPKTFYILSYDKNRVSSFLNDKGYDSNFIEKIIQQELNLPNPSQVAVYEVFEKGLNEIIDGQKIALSERDKKYFGELYHAGLNNAFSNIRSVKRALNVIDFEYSLLKDEVHFLDFCLVCIFRVYAPTVHEHIQKYGGNYLNGKPPKEEMVQSQYRNFKQELPLSEKWASPVLEEMFPVLGSDNFNQSFGSDIVAEWISDRRISTEEYFSRYFTMTVPFDEFSETVYSSIYSASGDAEEFRKILKRYVDEKKLGKLLQRLRARVEKFPEENIPNVISILLDEADYIDEKTMEFFGVNADDQAFYLSLNLLKSIPKEKRCETFKDAVKGTQSGINHLLRFVDYIGLDHGYLESRGSHSTLHESETYLSEMDFQESIDFVVDRISSADVDELIKRQAFASILFSLEDVRPKISETIKKQLLESENGFLKVVSLFCGWVRSSDAGTFRRVQFDSLRSYLKTEEHDKELGKKIEDAIEKSQDEELNELVRTSLDNANDPMK